MVTNVMVHTGEKPQLLYAVRIKDGKLQIEGNIPASHAQSLDIEYENFKKKHPDGSDEEFLRRQLMVMFANSSYVRPKFFAEG